MTNEPGESTSGCPAEFHRERGIVAAYLMRSDALCKKSFCDFSTNDGGGGTMSDEVQAEPSPILSLPDHLLEVVRNHSLSKADLGVMNAG